MTLAKYKAKIRTTLAETEGLPMMGIYVIAYMRKVVYIGKATRGIADRLEQHWYNRNKERLGNWMDKLKYDWENVRLDVLVPPDDVDARYWIEMAEGQLIRQFKPLFNESINERIIN